MWVTIRAKGDHKSESESTTENEREEYVRTHTQRETYKRDTEDGVYDILIVSRPPLKPSKPSKDTLVPIVSRNSLNASEECSTPVHVECKRDRDRDRDRDRERKREDEMK